jgi:hypothetical protein
MPLAAQTRVPMPFPISALPQALTTAIVGFTGSQTAQLNVLNMSPATTATVSGCEVQLAFYDSQNRLLKQGATTTIAPGVAATLFLGRSEIPVAAATMPRVSIRGQMKTVVPPTTTASEAGAAILAASCSLFASLEIYDNVTGATQVFTTDTRTVYTGTVMPMASGLPMAR